MTNTKIEQAVQAMLNNSSNITEVTSKEEGSFMFTYDGKYHWSMFPIGSDLILAYLPMEPDAKAIPFDSSEGSSHRERLFKELYQTLFEKNAGIGDVLDDIINNIPF